jgi:hypothetical protein
MRLCGLRAVEEPHEIIKLSDVCGGIRAHDLPDSNIKIVDAHCKRHLPTKIYICYFRFSFLDTTFAYEFASYECTACTSTKYAQQRVGTHSLQDNRHIDTKPMSCPIRMRWRLSGEGEEVTCIRAEQTQVRAAATHIACYVRGKWRGLWQMSYATVIKEVKSSGSIGTTVLGEATWWAVENDVQVARSQEVRMCKLCAL